jgi:hypothetical protein
VFVRASEGAPILMQFWRDLQVFYDWPGGQDTPFMCYSSVNQLLEPRSGGD